MTEPEMIAWIDGATTEELLRKWRFAPAGDPICSRSGPNAHLYQALMSRKADDPEAYIAASKAVGWKYRDPAGSR